jgi:hypothetical protein
LARQERASWEVVYLGWMFRGVHIPQDGVWDEVGVRGERVTRYIQRLMCINLN